MSLPRRRLAAPRDRVLDLSLSQQRRLLLVVVRTTLRVIEGGYEFHQVYSFVLSHFVISFSVIVSFSPSPILSPLSPFCSLFISLLSATLHYFVHTFHFQFLSFFLPSSFCLFPYPNFTISFLFPSLSHVSLVDF